MAPGFRWRAQQGKARTIRFFAKAVDNPEGNKRAGLEINVSAIAKVPVLENAVWSTGPTGAFNGNARGFWKKLLGDPRRRKALRLSMSNGPLDL